MKERNGKEASDVRTKRRRDQDQREERRAEESQEAIEGEQMWNCGRNLPRPHSQNKALPKLKRDKLEALLNKMRALGSLVL